MNAFDVAQAIRADCLCFRARRASRLITRAYDEALRPLGIQATQLTLMSAIAAAGEFGQTMGSLANVLAIDAATLSRNLRLIEKSGLADIGRSDSDRRVRIVRLTPAGERVLGEALPLWRAAQAEVVRALGGAEEASDLRARLDGAAKAMQAAFPG
jgi:DNA-binding MarR family transcriptional regulator